MRISIYFFGFILGGMIQTSQAIELPKTPAPKDAEVYFISPRDGEKIVGEVTVKFGLRGMGVAPAGIQMPDTGHHHLLINLATLPNLNQPLIKDEKHLHFGNGQTETTLKLKSGKHTLQLLLGDALHQPHAPPIISKKITIEVKAN